MDDGEVLSQRKSQPENDVTVHHVHQKRCVPGSIYVQFLPTAASVK